MVQQFCLGKSPAREGAVKLALKKYVNLSTLPTPPSDFGHADMVSGAFGMLGNDEYGDCVWAGAAHEHMLWSAEGGHTVRFLTEYVLQAYTAVTGFDRNKPNTDQGTDMQQAAAYRQKVGVKDIQGNMHKIGAYLALETGNIDEYLVATYLFGAIGGGFMIPDSCQEQFAHHLPWKPITGSPIEGGHYVPIMGHRQGMFIGCTWGALQPITHDFVTQYSDEALVYVSEERLMGGHTIEGFDAEQLAADLKVLQGS